MKLREMLYVPGLRDHHGLSIRLFSSILAQRRMPELKVSLARGENYMVLRTGDHIPLREGDGLLYLNCTAAHDQHPIFAGFFHKAPITK